MKSSGIPIAFTASKGRIWIVNASLDLSVGAVTDALVDAAPGPCYLKIMHVDPGLRAGWGLRQRSRSVDSAYLTHAQHKPIFLAGDLLSVYQIGRHFIALGSGRRSSSILGSLVTPTEVLICDDFAQVLGGSLLRIPSLVSKLASQVPPDVVPQLFVEPESELGR